MASNEQYKNNSKCWYCKHAVPTLKIDPRTDEKEYTQGCPWSIYAIPVKGWDAEKSEMKVNGRIRDTYYVNDCPLFERGRH